jgi:AcrR family transcriptional regulator
MLSKTINKNSEIRQSLSQVDSLVSSGLTIKVACEKLGIAKPTYYRWRREQKPITSSDAFQSQTAQHILNVAETLFAEHGLDVSFREIGRKAKVSIGTLSYHFKTRNELLYQITDRRVNQLDEKRYKLLNEAVARSNPLDLESVITAFFLPGLEAAQSTDTGLANYMRFLGRMALDPSEEMQSIMSRCYSNLHKRFIFAFSRALPDLSIEEVYWRYMALTGVFVTMTQNPNRIRRISSGLVNMVHPEEATRKMLPFLVPMMRSK